MGLCLNHLLEAIFLDSKSALVQFCALSFFFFCTQLKGKHRWQSAIEKTFFTTPDVKTPSTAKKYGGLIPKKKPLISKDHERAYFDSADWALFKHGAGVNQQSTEPVETLQPKLKRTPHQQLPPRRPACTSG